MDNKLPNILLMLTITSPDETFFSGACDAITSTNEKGKFDVLPYHENFISIISEFVTIYKNGAVLKTLQLEKGILRAERNTVQIYLGIETV